MVSIQLVSDLHIEAESTLTIDPLSIVTPSAPILVLAGDIGSLYKMKNLETFLSALAKHYVAVFYTPGNHEYYTMPGIPPCTFEVLTKRLYSLENTVPNLTVLDRQSAIIDNVCLVGCTLWSRPLVGIPKFIVRIHGMTTERYLALHTRDVTYLQMMRRYCKDKCLRMVVVTHHSPTYSILPVKGNRPDPYISLYASELDALMSSPVKIWACGHLHLNFDKTMLSGCRFVGNQRGKRKRQASGYSPTKTLEI